MKPEIVLYVDKKTMVTLKKPVRGDGGFQTLMRRLQRNLIVNNGKIKLSLEDAIKLYKYATKTGQGGFQSRLSRFLPHLQEITNMCVEMFAN